MNHINDRILKYIKKNKNRVLTFQFNSVNLIKHQIKKAITSKDLFRNNECVVNNKIFKNYTLTNFVLWCYNENPPRNAESDKKLKIIFCKKGLDEG